MHNSVTEFSVRALTMLYPTPMNMMLIIPQTSFVSTSINLMFPCYLTSVPLCIVPVTNYGNFKQFSYS